MTGNLTDSCGNTSAATTADMNCPWTLPSVGERLKWAAPRPLAQCPPSPLPGTW